MNFTDIHTHMIPDVDDGAPDMNTAEAMLEIAYGEGIRRIIATPHYGLRNMSYQPEKAESAFEQLQNLCSEKFPDIELYMGSELYFDLGAMSGLKEGRAKTLAGTEYVLTEFPFDSDYEYMLHGVRQLTMSKYIPVLAHIERYKKAVRNKEKLSLLVQNGALIQMNADTVARQSMGFFGSRAWEVRMLQADLVHFIATDTHDEKFRPPLMREAAEKLKEIVGEKKARQILIDNPEWLF